MSEQKYEILTDDFKFVEDGKRVFRIKSLKTFRKHKDSYFGPYEYIEKGELGGYIETISNLSQNGSCWVGSEAIVYGSSSVTGNSNITDKAVVIDSTIKGYSTIAGSSVIRNSNIKGLARIGGDSVIVGCEITDIRVMNSHLEDDIFNRYDITKSLKKRFIMSIESNIDVIADLGYDNEIRFSVPKEGLFNLSVEEFTKRIAMNEKIGLNKIRNNKYRRAIKAAKAYFN